MRPKSLILLALALGCGLVASIGISQVLESRRNHKSTEEQSNVLVALTNIERTDQFTKENVALKPWPADRVPEGAITSLDKVLGLRPNARIIKEEMILDGKVGGSEGSAPASGDIPPGYGAAVVRMDNAQNAGLIMPGDRVDVQVFINKGANVPEATTTTFLHDISVLAVNSETRIEPGSNAKIDARNVSLLVTPEQANELTLAQEIGSVRLFLRGPKSEKVKDKIKVTPGHLLGTNTSKAPETPAAATAPPTDFTKFLKAQPVVQEPVGPRELFKMIVQHGDAAHLETMYEGELMPRKTSLDGQTITPDAGTAAVAPLQHVPSSDEDSPKPSTPTTAPTSTLHRSAD